jgi:PAS domain S-box-containing protein
MVSMFAQSFNNTKEYFHGNALIMLLIDPSSGKIIKANKTAANFYGYSMEELQTLSIKDINTFTTQQIQKEMQNAKKQNRNYFIFRHKLANGQIKRVHVYSHPIEYNNKRVLYSTIHDMTNSQLTQEELNYYSKTLEEQIDLKSKALIQEEVNKNNILFIGIMLQFFVMFLLFKNIQRRKQAEKNLANNLKTVQDSQQQLQEIINSFPIAIIKTDANFKNIDYFNDAFHTLFGWNNQDIPTVLQWTLKAYPHPTYQKYVSRQWQALVEQTHEQGLKTSRNAIHVKVQCKDESIKQCQLWYHQNQGNIYGIFYDVTKQMALEKENLEQQNMLLTQAKIAAVGEMLANIAHQWRQPLSSISSQVSGLKVQMDFTQEISHDDIKECANNVLKQVQYLSTTIDDFKNFLSSDLQNIQTFNVKNSIHKLYGLIKDSLNNNYIQCHMHLADIEVTYNENKLIQALLNICNNAKDAMVLNNIDSDDRHLFIDIQTQDNLLQIKLKDSGGGIDPTIMDKIFEPYFTTKHKSLGTGIGLYMSYQLIHNSFNHGSIKVKNRQYKHNNTSLKGAEFIIAFPLNQTKDSK